MAEAEYPPKTILIGLVLIAVLAIGTLVGMVIHLNNLESSAANQPSTQAPANSR
jgi:uncharacterized membrane protein